MESVLGLVLLNLSIHDLVLEGNEEVAKFTDDTELFTMIKTTGDCELVPKDLAKLGE